MNLPDKSQLPGFSRKEEVNSQNMVKQNEESEDSNPDLDKGDLEENNFTIEEADQCQWEPAKTGSSGSEEKDITD